MFKSMLTKCICKCESAQLEEHSDPNTDMWFPWLLRACRSVNWNQRAPLKTEAEDQQSCYITHRHTHTSDVPSKKLYFGLFIWIQEKGKGLSMFHCTQRGSCSGPEPGGVSPHSHPVFSFLFSFFSNELVTAASA